MADLDQVHWRLERKHETRVWNPDLQKWRQIRRNVGVKQETWTRNLLETHWRKIKERIHWRLG